MATPTTVAPIAGSATPYSIKLRLIGTGVPGLLSITGFRVALAQGPLRDVLLGAAPADLDHFNVDGVRGSEIRIYDAASAAADAPEPRAGAYSIAWVANADPAVAGLAVTLISLDARVIEIRLNHKTQA